MSLPGSERELRMETRAKRRRMVEDEEECRLTDMAPETVCMLVAWVKTGALVEMRATCRTLKRAVDEVAPWKMRRKKKLWLLHSMNLWSLVATDADVMRRTALHASRQLYGQVSLATYMAAKMGDVAVFEILKKNGCSMNGEVCRSAKRHGHETLLVWLHPRMYHACPCSHGPCKWVLKRELSQ